MNLTCPKCDHSWNFRGKAKRAQCPKCKQFFNNPAWKPADSSNIPAKTSTSISADLMQGSVSVVLARSWLQSKCSTVNSFNSARKCGSHPKGKEGSESSPDSYRSIAKFLS